METGAATVEKSVGGSSKKIKTELPYDQAILLLGKYLDTCLNWKGTTAVLLTIAKTWKQPKCSLMDGCRRCEIYKYLDLEIITLREVSQKDKDKYHMMPFTCGESKI